jgi:hypothetical protein
MIAGGNGSADCGVRVKQLSDALKIVTQEDVELAKKPPVRMAEQNPGNDADPGNLMSLLGDIDGLKNEIHERMRRVEAVKQAKSVLQEDAERTEALNKRLAELAKIMSGAGIHAPEIEKETAELARTQARETLAPAEPRQSQVKVLNEGVALVWPKTDEPSEEAQIETAEPAEAIAADQEQAPVAAENSLALESALQRLEESEQSRVQAWMKADESAQEARRLFEDAQSQLNHAVSREEQAAQEFHSAQEALTAAFQAAQDRLEEAERSREAARTQAWTRTEEATEEAKRLLEEATSQLHHAGSREEQAAQEFHSAQEAFTAARQSVTERLDEADLRWKKTDEAVIEARKLLDQATAELIQARKREESIAANLQSVRQEFTASYQSASERLQEAELFWKRGDQASKESQQLVDQSTAELLQARKSEETAAADLLSARQELTTAYQFAAVAAQRRLDAVDSFQKAVRWMAFAVALSWIAMAWMGWFALHAKVPVWAPGIVSILLLVLAAAFTRKGAQEA